MPGVAMTEQVPTFSRPRSSKARGGFNGDRDRKPGGGKGKRSFMQKAKKFGKQGKLGRGYEVDEETYNYFVRIFQMLNSEFDSEDDKESFVENSLSLAEGNEVNLCSNQLVSRVIENILPLSSEARISKFCDAFTPSLRVIVADPFASHVLEKMLELTSSDKWRSSEKLTGWFETASMFILNNFEDFTFDKYASFVTKKVLECLSGHVQLPADKMNLVFKQNTQLQVELYGQRKYNEKWEEMLQKFSLRFAAWPQFNDLGHRPETARLLQNVIETVNKTKNSKEVVSNLVMRVLETFPDKLQPTDMAHRTLEVCMSVVDSKLYGIIFDKYYKGHLIEYGSLSGGLFTLQKIISCCPQEQYFTAVLDELTPLMDALFREGRISILNGLIEQSVKLEVKQKELLKLLKGAAAACGKDNENLAMALATMEHVVETTDNDAQDQNENETKVASRPQKFSYHGCTAIQALMDFKDPQEILKSICQLDATQLRKLALDPKGSFVITKFFKGWNIPNKHKLNLLDKFKDSLVEFAVTKFGTRIIDVIWLWAPIQQKSVIAESLGDRISLLAANKYGRFLVDNFGLNAFKRNRKEWVEHMISEGKKKKDVLDIVAELGLKPEQAKELEITTEGTPKKKKKNKRKSEPTEDSKLEEEEFAPNLEETPRKKKKKNRKSDATLSQDNEEEGLEKALETPSEETPRKKKKKNRKSDVAPFQENDVDLEETIVPTPETEGKKKKRKSASFQEAEIAEAETPKKKKKKNRNSGLEATEVVDNPHPAEEHETPSKKKKKDRKSKQF